MEAVVAPFDQVTAGSEEVRTMELPSQKVVGPLAVTTGGLIAVTLIAFEAAEEHPLVITTTE
jgi:hypothetical protein